MYLIQVIEFNTLTENLFGQNSNKEFVLTYLINFLSNSFTNLNKLQIETFCIALFNKCYTYHDFKILIRDFLTTLKSFSGNNEELFEEEKKVIIN
jgi:exportin-1